MACSARVSAIVLHVGNVRRWVPAVVRSGSAVDEAAVAMMHGTATEAPRSSVGSPNGVVSACSLRLRRLFTRRGGRPWNRATVRRAVISIVAVGAAAIALTACGAGPGAPRATPPSSIVTPSQPAADAADARSVTIGALPERTSLLLHGQAPLAPLEPAMQEDLLTLARDTNADPDQTVLDYAAQPAFDQAVRKAQTAKAGYADAVFHAGEHAASELRFVDRPPENLLDELRRDYPRDLLIQWGEHLVGDYDRDRFSGSVNEIVRQVPDTGNVTTSIDGDGRLTVEYDRTAQPHTVSEALLAAPEFQTFFVHGKPPTEVRVQQVDDASASFG